MKTVYLVDGLRTPFGSFGGALSDISAPELASVVIKELQKKYRLPEDAVDEVIMGQVIQGGSKQAPARIAMRLAGLSDSTHAMTINKVCGSGLKSFMLGTQSIMLGDSHIVYAGGMENMSMAPYALDKARFGYRMGQSSIYDLMIYDALQDPYSGKHMGEITEESIKKNGLSRKEQDDYAIRSYTLAQMAIEKRILDREIVGVAKKTKKGEILVDKDEEPFKGDITKIETLKPAFIKDGTITAGNASKINDGAAVGLLADDEAVKKYNFNPKIRIVAYSTNSIHPDDFGEAPIGAIEKVLAKAKLDLNQIDLFEINEAFAAVPLMAIKKLKIDINKVNVNGGAVAFGHPVGASGARLLITLSRELIARNLKYGIATLCIGGGEAVAVLAEKIN
ncbi:MAG: thiolase family protein [Calditerrivibrio sp.]|nr:thiolase family protein [Calditerrivibrio sp.]MCA1979985.1 thiolase family protein [Calditerrivibrio sp.]